MLAACATCAPRGSKFEQDCSLCETDPELRKRWGCDEPAAEPVFGLSPCPWCNGAAKCDHCDGTNVLPVYRCPNKLFTQREVDAIAAAVLVERGILPDPGGWQDQAATFTAAWPLVMREVEHWRAEHQKLAMQKAKQKQRR